ncbi:hypothetical protein [Actinoplanes regularis]|uniref:hypothetical protein n=1 Tax=Actinoplanes regularis TaxID=52697 RepID=UPI0024A0EABD|nr:hypothetical protein [Actinoplanes regularis]GLW32270.1 hypothetical protein Areg01_52090 [Actinoplanes regularis]
MVLRVKESFSYDRDGVPLVMRAGDLVPDDDPCVAGREVHFELVEDVASRTSTSAVETATAAPGERRSVAKPAAQGKPARS